MRMSAPVRRLKTKLMMTRILPMVVMIDPPARHHSEAWHPGSPAPRLTPGKHHGAANAAHLRIESPPRLEGRDYAHALQSCQAHLSWLPGRAWELTVVSGRD